ncbi:MAG TPA: hypothetical protein VFE24_14550 [Pirellulales bacterium]|jgi:hypothetical protein|nr:hypothetical protein [Pirellulales bacterium]
MAATLASKLQRELKHSPKKAAFLALLCLVAVYFWLPLIFGNKEKETTETNKSAHKTTPVAGSPVAATPANGKEGFTPPAWRNVIEWIENDRRRRPVAPSIAGRDPFETPKVIEVKPVERVVAATPNEITPQQANLTLNSTLIGAKRRVAVINGKVYKTGQTIRGKMENASYEFVVQEIDAREVVLATSLRRYEIKLRELASLNAAEDSSDNH